MVSSLIFQKFSGEGLTEPPPQTPPPDFSRASPSVRASPSILGRFAPSTRASPSILGRFAPSIRASPLTFDCGPWFGPPKINSWIRPCLISHPFNSTRANVTSIAGPRFHSFFSYVVFNFFLAMSWNKVYKNFTPFIIKLLLIVTLYVEPLA